MKRVVAVLAGGLLNAFAWACVGFAPPGQSVNFGDQSNIIVWNPETKTESFVRNAFFNSKAKDFGFVAATPSVPDLSEANEHIFEVLESLKPQDNARMAGVAAASNSASVEVLQIVDVGKYQATSIRSDDPAALAAYLKQNGYATRLDSDEWIKFYTDKKWILTAFKVRSGGGKGSQTGVIRMSFKTVEPFNPYYVPSGNSSEGGTLKVYFVSNGTYSATVGHDENWNRAVWHAGMDETVTNQLATSLKMSAAAIPKNATVTYFEEQNWLEGAKDDLYFKKDNSMTTVIVIGLGIAAGGLWWFTRNRKTKILADLSPKSDS